MLEAATKRSPVQGVAVKICGIMQPEHALVAARGGAGMLGMVFAPSRRQISVEAARAIGATLDGEERRPLLVGVFVNESTRRMLEIAEQVGLDVLQLSGDEIVEQVAECAEHYPVIKALRFPADMSMEQVLDALQPYAALDLGDRVRLLLDTYRAGEYGGTGETADWSLASQLAARFPIILAGGLTPENVGEAINSVLPFGVDVSSGVESGGTKDSSLINQFIEAAYAVGLPGKDDKMVNITEEAPGIEQAYNMPDAGGHFGQFGGKYAPEVLMPALAELEEAYARYKDEPAFLNELRDLEKHYVGRATPLYFAESLTREMGGARVYLKREDLAHTGAHKINNALGQALLAKRMGKHRIIAETGAGQHGVATATVCAMLGLECIVYMGEVDIQRQALNVFRMKLLGAEVRPVSSGSRTLKDAINEAVRDWVGNVHTTYYLIGSVVGMHPYPTIVRDFQSVIGKEARQQSLEQTSQLPDYVVACVGGGSNSIGIFYPFIGDAAVRLVGVEAAGEGIGTGKHASTLSAGSIGVLHGSRSYMLQDDHGQVVETHSISAGLDYPGVGPEHSYLRETGRAEYLGVTDEEALEGFKLLCRTEGIIPALESAHAIYYGAKLAASLTADKIVMINLSGRGDKDMGTVAEALGITLTGTEAAAATGDTDKASA